MSFDILQQEKHCSGDRDLTITPYISNKASILIANLLLKISKKKQFDFNMKCVLV